MKQKKPLVSFSWPHLQDLPLPSDKRYADGLKSMRALMEAAVGVESILHRFHCFFTKGRADFLNGRSVCFDRSNRDLDTWKATYCILQ